MGDDDEVYRALVDGLDDDERRRTLEMIAENNAQTLARLRGTVPPEEPADPSDPPDEQA